MRRAADAARAATDRYGRVPPAGPDQPAWAWWRWSTRRPSTPVSSTSLGVYRLALLYLRQLAHDERFAAAVTAEDAETLIAAALLHDLGHWPFCHPIEDIRLPSVPSHELFANSFLAGGRDRRRAAARLGHQSPRRGRPVERKAPRPGGRGSSPACSPARSTSTRWIISTATACTPACPTAGTSTSSGSWAACV